MKFGIDHPGFSFDGKGPEMVESLRTGKAEQQRVRGGKPS
jgi:hypothetical protein